jgi:phosphatidate phosphatase PAH1
MRNLTVLLVAMLCASCSLLPFDIQQAPLKPYQAVVLDIDGTLTPTEPAIFTARKDAADALRIFANNGYKIIYLSARSTLLQAGIPDWLKKNHFPEGSIHVPQTALFSDEAKVAFKRGILDAYREKNWDFVAAYGDSSTDFAAYAAAGIPKERVFALRREGETWCECGVWEACLNGWTEHLDFITKSVQSVPAN